VISKRCLHCHAESSLALAERELADPRAALTIGKNYPGAAGALQASMCHILNPQISWVMCAKHRRIQRAARAELEREDRARMEAWRASEAARVAGTLPDVVESPDHPTAR